jgi:outer membrane protein
MVDFPLKSFRLFLSGFVVFLSVCGCDLFCFVSHSAKQDSTKQNSGQNSVKQDSAKASGKGKKDIIGALVAAVPPVIHLLVENTLKNNPEIKSEESGLKAFIEGYGREIGATFRPDLSASCSGSTSSTRSWQPPSAANQYNNSDSYNKSSSYSWGGGVDLKQNVFNGFRDWFSCEAFAASVKLHGARLEEKKQEIVKRVLDAFADLAEKRAVLSHLSMLLRFRENSLIVAQESLSAGSGKPVDVSLAHAEVWRTKSEIENTQSAIVSLEAQIESLTQAPSPKGDFDFSSFSPMEESWVPDTLLPAALKNNLSIFAAERQIESAEAGLKRTVNGLFCPSVDLSGAVRYHGPGSDSRSVGYSLGLSASVRLYDGGANSSSKRQAACQLEEAKLKRATAWQSVEAELKAICASGQAASLGIGFCRSAVESHRSGVADLEEEYRAGVKIMNDVLEGYERLQKSLQMLVTAEKNLFVSRISLLVCLGRLREFPSGASVGGFDYMGYFLAVKSKWF